MSIRSAHTIYGEKLAQQFFSVKIVAQSREYGVVVAPIVSVVVAKTAAERNKLKRRIRAVAREGLKNQKKTARVTIIARKGAQNLPFREIKKQINHLLGQKT